MLENPATEDPTNETHGIKVETRYQTGNPNSYQLTSNPFRAATATEATESFLSFSRIQFVTSIKRLTIYATRVRLVTTGGPQPILFENPVRR